MKRRRLALIGLLLPMLALVGCGRGGQSEPAKAVPPVSDRGPGMRRQSAPALRLPVSRSLDLTHVEPQHVAAALEDDPVRIFEFVRDQIAYEVYTGALRGPRGTLLAMAGNSVDRAALLASMLQHAGQQVRYARGALPDREARALVTSMWATRPQPALSAKDGDGAAAAKAVAQRLLQSAQRDYKLIRQQLQKARRSASRSTPSLDALVAETRSHYWVQWAKDGGWTNLDPSFGDATPGQAYARPEETFEALPEAVFHRVVVRLRLEEYRGDAPATREILTHSTRAAELSGRDLLLLHLPENWTGPSTSLADATAAALGDTGRVKAVLLGSDDQVLMSEAFRQKLKTTGIRGVGSLLGGEGTRTTPVLATAEWLEFDFLAPDGGRHTVIREIFDLAGKARRLAGQRLSSKEVREKSASPTALDVTSLIYALWFTTGGLYAGHLSDLAPDQRPDGGYVDLRSALRRLGIAFTAVSDGVLSRLGEPDRTVVLLYPNSPRLIISELSRKPELIRVALDLRQNRLRAVALGPHPDAVFAASIARGVTDGTIERLLGEFVTPHAGQKDAAAPAMSTSLLFERAAAERIGTVLLPDDMDRTSLGGLEDSLAAVRKEAADGYVVVAPQRAVSIGGKQRYGWWRVNPASGETTAVTDEGLHATVVEYHIVKGKRSGEVHVVRMEWVGNRLVGDEMRTFQFGTGHLANYIRELMFEGARLRSFFSTVF